MKTFNIFSPHGSVYCYDYVIYLSLRNELIKLGLKEDNNSHNRIYLMGYPMGRKYRNGISFNPNCLNIALIGSYYDHIKHRGELECFKFVYVSSPQGYQYLIDKFNFRADGIWNLYSPFGNTDIPDFELTQKSINIEELDIGFVGNARVRPAVEELMVIIDKYNWTFKYYGYNIQGYMGNPKAKKYDAGVLPYHQYPEFAKKTKIVILDMHDTMATIGMPSFKLIDMLMNKAFVMIYKNKYVRDQLKGVIFDHTDIEQKILHYLGNEKERQKIVDRQYELIKDTNTVMRTAVQMKGIIDYYGK